MAVSRPAGDAHSPSPKSHTPSLPHMNTVLTKGDADKRGNRLALRAERPWARVPPGATLAGMGEVSVSRGRDHRAHRSRGSRIAAGTRGRRDKAREEQL